MICLTIGNSDGSYIYKVSDKRWHKIRNPEILDEIINELKFWFSNTREGVSPMFYLYDDYKYYLGNSRSIYLHYKHLLWKEV